MKIGLALGSGGARGFAHAGVIKVLEEENIPIHMIAGSSMGALVGALYASGMSTERLYRLAMAFRRNDYIDWTLPKMGLIAGRHIKQFISVMTKQKRIEDARIPLAVVATDLQKGKKVVFREGNIADAVRASISIPGIFVPERLNGRLLVDGGVIDRVPATVVRDMGADVVIAVDVASVKKNDALTSIFDVILQSLDIIQAELASHRIAQADIVIRPQLERYSSYAFTHAKEMIQMGEEAARQQLPIIRQLLAEKGVKR